MKQDHNFCRKTPPTSNKQYRKYQNISWRNYFREIRNLMQDGGVLLHCTGKLKDCANGYQQQVLSTHVRAHSAILHHRWFIDQFDLVLKWLSSVVRARESTVGMQSIISLLMNLLSFLNENLIKCNLFQFLPPIIIINMSKSLYQWEWDIIVFKIRNYNEKDLKTYHLAILLQFPHLVKTVKTTLLVNLSCKILVVFPLMLDYFHLISIHGL